jgi:MtN3 and saliva related transmembrane protein
MLQQEPQENPPMEVSDMLGYLAGTLTTAALVPQVWRTFRTRDVSGISLRMYSIFTTGIAVWLAYGIFLKETPMMLANSVSLVLACAVLFMKLRYRKDERPAGGERVARA